MSSNTSTNNSFFQSAATQERDDKHYTPRQQPYWHHNGSTWTSSSKAPPSAPVSPKINPQNIRLISWNIDFQQPFDKVRMGAALDYLSSLVAAAPEEIPLVVFLQEMVSSDLAQIKDAPWIQEKFSVTDLDVYNWLEPSYGSTTLIDRRLKIENVFRVPWFSKFTRDGLFVDISLTASPEGKILRLCNTHLESLVAEPPVRPLQLQAAARYLHEAAAALIAGDFNAIQPFDRTLYLDNDLKDAYLELGGKEDSDEGYTWGYQVENWLREKFGCSRMDKIMFTGVIRSKAFERVGIDVKVPKEHRRKLKAATGTEWATDHYGVMGDFELTEGMELSVPGGGEVEHKLEQV